MFILTRTGGPAAVRPDSDGWPGGAALSPGSGAGQLWTPAALARSAARTCLLAPAAAEVAATFAGAPVG
ncbi:hypothetical protein Pen02_69040 [Plantactinospora endophytica]|uniref:Uncharacterized protein n=1 Tax=Plantactinospora endophytica TaxID=673535 RepID=A0ABQ4EB68_9ACTN|nr:hypothetical protein Pen02_69040 [Plantactinospora endophytica]